MLTSSMYISINNNQSYLWKAKGVLSVTLTVLLICICCTGNGQQSLFKLFRIAVIRHNLITSMVALAGLQLCPHRHNKLCNPTHFSQNQVV